MRTKVAIVVAALLCAFAPVSPRFIERWYATGVYPRIQQVLTPISNVIPFALFDVLTIGAATLVVGAIVRAVRRARQTRRFSILLVTLGNLVVGAAVAYLMFLFLWGFNYRRMSMAERLVLDGARPTPDAARALGQRAVQELNTLYEAAHAKGDTPPWRDESMRSAFERVQRFLTHATPAVPGRLKATIYGPYFRWTSVDGMVDPFALEVMANPDLLPVERSFVAAHEWAHLAGYADESEANFVGWLTCVQGDARAKYSGWMFLYWQLSGEVSAADRTLLAAMLESGPRRDIDDIAERLRRGRWPLLQRSSWTVYDQYLKANRVEAGIRSYGLVVTLILRAQFDEEWRPKVREPTRD
ncbi:MAG TPA: DUF3810 family protein [Vicinamibacterales bacterium]|nr:DUF3810 family protein [Vicinamibacterales bacterium]